MENVNITTLPKGTIVKVDGFPVELVSDVSVIGEVPESHPECQSVEKDNTDVIS